MDLRLQNKVVVITGGTAGIGRATALEFAREGAAVIVTGRDEGKFAAVERELAAIGAPFLCRKADVTDREQMRRLIDEVVDRFGRLDVWINNAGAAINHDCQQYSEQEWDFLLDIDLKSVFFCSQLAAEQMKRQNSGVILNASSFAVRIPHANGAVYAAAKAGVSSLTRTFAACLAPWNIRVIGYIPGMIVTEMSASMIEEHREKLVRDIPLGRLGSPEDLAKPIVFLASDAAGYITGTDIEVTGGKFAVQDASYAWTEYANPQKTP